MSAVTGGPSHTDRGGSHAPTEGVVGARDLGNRTRRSSTKSTETKHSSKTSELYAFVAVLAGILIAGLVTDGADDFGPTKVWLYVTILTVGYMVSRGLAKAGSKDPYTDDTDRQPSRRIREQPRARRALTGRCAGPLAGCARRHGFSAAAS